MLEYWFGRLDNVFDWNLARGEGEVHSFGENLGFHRGETGRSISARVKEHQAHGRLGHLDKSAKCASLQPYLSLSIISSPAFSWGRTEYTVRNVETTTALFRANSSLCRDLYMNYTLFTLHCYSAGLFLLARHNHIIAWSFGCNIKP